MKKIVIIYLAATSITLTVFCKANQYNNSVKDYIVETVNSYSYAESAESADVISIDDKYIYIRGQHNIVKDGVPRDICYDCNSVCRLKKD